MLVVVLPQKGGNKAALLRGRTLHRDISEHINQEFRDKGFDV